MIPASLYSQLLPVLSPFAQEHYDPINTCYLLLPLTEEKHNIKNSAPSKEKIKKPTHAPHYPTVFSQNTYKRVPAKDQIVYDNTTTPSRPLFDTKWISHLACYFQEPCTFRSPKFYLLHAQVLLDRFFEKNPSLACETNRALHPNIMLMALHLTFKKQEDLAIWNIDNLDFLLGKAASNVTTQDRQEFNQMERAYLIACKHELHTEIDPKDELHTILYKYHVSDERLHAMLHSGRPGDFLIYAEGDHYILAVKNAEVICYPFFLKGTGEITYDMFPYTLSESGLRNKHPAPSQPLYKNLEAFLYDCKASGNLPYSTY